MSSRAEQRRLLADLRREYARNRLFVYSSAIAYRALVSLVPLILLGLALLGALGLQRTWRNSIAPVLDPRLEPEVAKALNAVVLRILHSPTAGLIAFASLLVLWDVSLAVTGVMDALNRIHHVKEERSLLRRVGTAVALAAATTVCLVGSVLIMTVAPLVGSGWVHWVFGIGRWLVVPVVLGAAVALLVRYAPAERVATSWASVGSAVVIVVWLAASVLFRWWITVANYKSAAGSLTVFLTLSVYVLVTSSIFLVGAQIDELLRRRARSSAGPSRS